VITIRRIEPADWAVLRQVRLRALADSPGAFASTLSAEEAFGEDRWRETVRGDGRAWYVAFDDRWPVGLAAGYRTAGASDWHLVSVWVDPGWRGHRVADRSIRAVAHTARQEDGHRLYLWVVEANSSARGLYHRFGFVPTGRTQPLPSDPTVGEMEMVLDLQVALVDSDSDTGPEAGLFDQDR
jgi:GNAT superfamily N-acetyltransferase